MKILDSYRRLTFDTIPIYLQPEKPDWFIPTPKADFILRNLKRGGALPTIAQKFNQKFGCDFFQALLLINNLLSRFDNRRPAKYPGRRYYHQLQNLKECWFHVTDQCTMTCKHCMFSSNRKTQTSLDYGKLMNTIGEAYCLGCKVFFFTGGEPFLYAGLKEACDAILKKGDTRVVILTNGKDVRKFEGWLQKIPADRLHFQISMDGLEKAHDTIRGRGAFQALLISLRFLKKFGFPITLAMTVTRHNFQEMASIVTIAQELEINNIHYLWFFKKGKGEPHFFVPPSIIFSELRKAYEKARHQNIIIDNVESIKSQIFSLPGTKFDLSNAGWESIAVGPDETIYPSPALIGERELAAGTIADGLENVWKKSPVFKKLRTSSLIQDKKEGRNPLKFLTGGGDCDHSYIAGKTFVGADSYGELYNLIALYLLAQAAKGYEQNDKVGLVCRMGERLLVCDEKSAPVAFTHSNCFLSIPKKNLHDGVTAFYTRATESLNTDIVNPVSYPEEEISHIPSEARVCSYGCGSPILDCSLSPGETMVDLGCGIGVECFMGAKKVGSQGLIIGIDMLPVMLNRARNIAEKVATVLGFNNVRFIRGLLEEIPLPPESVDVVISNCVINLSPDKRQTFREVKRILKPGGRLCICDIVSEGNVPLEIQYNEKLRGECLGGAMKESELFALLEDLSFEKIFVQKRFLYRQIEDHKFYSLTYTACKPEPTCSQQILYRGPFNAVISDDGKIIRRGKPQHLNFPSRVSLNESFFVFDQQGTNTNVEQKATCCCSPSPEVSQARRPETGAHKSATGCVVCGKELQYLSDSHHSECFYCGRLCLSNAICVDGHFICDQCHSRDALEVIQSVCLNAPHRDMIALLQKIRTHPSLNMQGPEHHSLVPAIILSVYKNLGGNSTGQDILTAIEQGKTIVGGACSFLGICGAAMGVGIAFSIILKANPYAGEKRQIVMNITRSVAGRIARYKAARCCQRESWLALKTASQLSLKYLKHFLPAETELRCTQFNLNKECIRTGCPLWDQAGQIRAQE
ncbi:MAG: DUF5714 domain-containing protein [Thermodesulfobacteriota bacterium]|jgi:MoaA/NifB/PqqE/SkfB family radical SAM enzyme/ubiquinone/menaquinone biosynthesis C-methylase UbiE|nr:MAG: DUF5714 domain-containing protein [Thermodesulfobacteriota bacterium]